MVIYEANPVPPLLRDVAAGKWETGYASQGHQQNELRRQQAQLNEAVAEQRARAAVERELAAEAARQGRYF